MNTLKAVIASAMLTPVASAQLFVEQVMFGGGRVFNETRSNDGFDADQDNFRIQFDKGFMDFSEVMEAQSTVADQASALSDQFHTTEVIRGEDQLGFRSIANFASVGSAELPDQGDLPNRSSGTSDGSLVMLFEATDRFVFTLEGQIIASTTGNSDTLVQIFFYSRSGVVMSTAVAARGDDGLMVLDLNERFILEPGDYALEIISFARMETVLFDNGVGTASSTSTSGWVLDVDMSPFKPKLGAFKP